MAWRLSGQLIESCSCNMFCPCWFGLPELAIQDQGYFAGAVAVRIAQGQADGVDLSGRTVVVAVHWADVLFNGNGTGRVYLEESASADQRRQLEAIFQGQQGGPMAALGALIGTWLPTRTAPIRVQDEGDTITVAVGDAGEVKSQRLRDMEGQGFTLQGGGFVAGLGLQPAELAPSSTRWSDAELPRPFETKSGARGAITWSA